MPRGSVLGRADLLRVIKKHSSGSQGRLAALLGYELQRRDRVIKEKSEQRSKRSDDGDPRQDTDFIAGSLQPSRFLCPASLCFTVQTDGAGIEEGNDDIAPELHVPWTGRPTAPPPWPPLRRWRAMEPTLRAMLAPPSIRAEVDMERYIEGIARATIVTDLPRRLRRRWARRINVVLDRDPQLTPIWADQDALTRAIRQYAPGTDVRIVRLDDDGEPYSLVDEVETGGELDRMEGVVWLALSDLGALTGDSVDRWVRLARRVGVERSHALVPVAPERIAPDLRGLWQIEQWERSGPPLDREIRLELANRLLALLSPTVCFTPGLLRVMRRRVLPAADISVEIMAWNDPAIEARGARITALRPKEAERLRIEFMRDPKITDAMRLEALRLIRDWRTGDDTAVVAEEIWFSELLNLPRGAQDIWAADQHERGEESDIESARRYFRALEWRRRGFGEPLDWRSRARLSDIGARTRIPATETAFWDVVAAIKAPEPGFTPPRGVSLPIGAVPEIGETYIVQSGGYLVISSEKPLSPFVATILTGDGVIDVEQVEDVPPPTSLFSPLTTFRDPLPDGTPTPEMIAIPTGSFLMGSPEDEAQRDDDEGPQHRVEITEPFALAKYPVTFEEYDAFCEATGRDKPGDGGWGRRRRPVINVSWEDAQAYCAWLSEQTGEAYRLPSEAEWEYACRAGTTTRYWWGDDWDAKRANGTRDVGKTTEVGRYDPNPWKLYDTHGNVWEWCEDHGLDDYSEMRGQAAFTANSGETNRVIRGGSWNFIASSCRSAYRGGRRPGGRNDSIGFRPARGQASGAPAGSGGAAGGFGQARGAVSGANGERPGMAETPPPQGGGGSGGASPEPIRHRVMPGRSADPIPLSALPPGPFVIRTDRAELTIQRITRTELGWASGMGRDRFGLWADFTVEDIRQRLRWCPPGRFLMGSPEGEAGRWDDEGPQTEITLERGFWLFDTPVTQELYEAVTGQKNPSKFVSLTRPVEQVSWEEAQAFMKHLNERFETPKSEGDDLEFHLPSEAQWEYACRAGTTDATYAGPMEILGENNAPILDDIAWYGGNSGKDFELEDGHDSSDWEEKQYDHSKAGTMPVELKRANPWGVYDMLGNVFEWCEDAWEDSHEGAALDGSPRPASQQDGESDRVIRGGSWNGNARYCRSAYRLNRQPGVRYDAFGFRPARGQASGAQAVKQESAERSGLRSGEGSGERSELASTVSRIRKLVGFDKDKD